MNLPALPYLLESSLSALQESELKLLDLAAQAEKRAKMELAQAVAYRGQADIYRFLIDHRDDMINLSKRIVDGKQATLRFEEFALRRTA